VGGPAAEAASGAAGCAAASLPDDLPLAPMLRPPDAGAGTMLVVGAAAEAAVGLAAAMGGAAVAASCTTGALGGGLTLAVRALQPLTRT